MPGFTLHKYDTARHCAAVLSALPLGNIRSMKVAVVKERRAFEHRVAASPDTVKRMIGMGLEVVVESGAGEGAWFSDAAFARAGASMATDQANQFTFFITMPMRSSENSDGLRFPSTLPAAAGRQLARIVPGRSPPR